MPTGVHEVIFWVGYWLKLSVITNIVPEQRLKHSNSHEKFHHITNFMFERSVVQFGLQCLLLTKLKCVICAVTQPSYEIMFTGEEN